MREKTKVLLEIQENAMRFVFEKTKGHSSQWAAIASVSVKIGCRVEALRRSVCQAETDLGRKTGLTTNERELLTPLQRENREIKGANQIPRAASIYFAKAGLGRHNK